MGKLYCLYIKKKKRYYKVKGWTGANTHCNNQGGGLDSQPFTLKLWESLVPSDCSAIARNNQEASNNKVYFIFILFKKQPPKDLDKDIWTFWYAHWPQPIHPFYKFPQLGRLSWWSVTFHPCWSHASSLRRWQPGEWGLLVDWHTLITVA